MLCHAFLVLVTILLCTAFCSAQNEDEGGEQEHDKYWKSGEEPFFNIQINK